MIELLITINHNIIFTLNLLVLKIFPKCLLSSKFKLMIPICFVIKHYRFDMKTSRVNQIL